MGKYVLLKTIYQGENFGSSLQAYALKNYIQDTFSVDCRVIERGEKGIGAKAFRIRKKMINVGKSLLSPRLFAESWTSHFAKPENRARFAQGIADAFRVFTETEIMPTALPLGELKRLARNEDCLLCITGSDQVWNPTGTHINEENFLRFSPFEKNLSYAASIGALEVPHYNRISFKSGVAHIRFLSVRENTAQELIQKKYDLQAQVCVDPVLLVGKEFWINRLQPTGETGPYVLAFFLNKLSQAASETIRAYVDRGERVKVLSREKFKEYGVDVDQIEELSPFQFLSMIREANSVLTDSFHGMMFSLIFNKEFFVYARNYGRHVSQSSRIVSLLERIGIRERYIEKPGTDVQLFRKLEYSAILPILEKERESSARFLAASFDRRREEQE